ncbi:hypothetical protein TanjilG_16135 [Lupinus angustifolius]|uniref:Uncharacterized protein n=1 Tax=Lupinus angustifolius TaxID=3871 RepID=A0A394DB84_LUPAN|nr:hypothetical protein TanjilG_16135 [Lupinus angustifolius]
MMVVKVVAMMTLMTIAEDSGGSDDDNIGGFECCNGSGRDDGGVIGLDLSTSS